MRSIILVRSDLSNYVVCFLARATVDSSSVALALMEESMVNYAPSPRRFS